MTRISISIRSPGAIASATFFTGLTLAVLFEDVVRGAPLTIGHGLTLGAIAGAITAGLWYAPARRLGAHGVAALLIVLGAASTAYIVVASGARNAEQSEARKARAETEAAERARLVAQRAAEDKRRTDTLDAITRKCVKGSASAKVCDKDRESLAVIEAGIAKIEDKIKALPPIVSVAGYKHAAAFLQGLGAPITETWLDRVMPWLIVLIAEIGTVACAHLGAHVRLIEEPEEMPAPPAKTDPVVNWVREYQLRTGRKPKLPEVEQQFPDIPRTTAWRRLRAA